MGRHEIEPLDQEEDLLKRSPAQRSVLLVGSGLALVAFLLPSLLLILGMLQPSPKPPPPEPAGILS
ncbi:MAG: hypothetical protein CBB79_01620 [Synechococcus sp. TMED19]|nr:MAG: hypothetical protein CBB79_01620 [Synechococcus sp. TMED19]